MLFTNSCLTVLQPNPVGYSPPGSSVHGILRARILEWTAISFSRGASRPRNRTRAPALTGGFFTTEPTGEALGTKVPGMCPAPHSGNSARILLGPSVPVEVTSVARRPSLQRGSAVRGIPWFPGMSVEDSEPVTGGAGSVTACSDTVPVRTAVDGPQSILGQGSSPARLSRLCFHSRDAGSIPGRGAMISRAAWCSQKNKRVWG